MIYVGDTASFKELLAKDESVTAHQQNLQSPAIEIFKVTSGIVIEMFKVTSGIELPFPHY